MKTGSDTKIVKSVNIAAKIDKNENNFSVNITTDSDKLHNQNIRSDEINASNLSTNIAKHIDNESHASSLTILKRAEITKDAESLVKNETSLDFKMESPNEISVTTHEQSENFYICCRSCRKGFNTLECFSVHNCNKRKSNPVVNVHKCKFCPSTFSQMHHLKRHIEGHKRNFCRFCNAQFTKRKVLCKHLKTMHNIIEPCKMYNCLFCEQHFSSKQSLNTHMKSHVNKKYFCLKCTFASDDEVVYRNHVKEHVKSSKYECHLCGYKFVRHQQYNQHMMGHDRHSCPECNVTFSTKKLLLKHRQSMHNVVHVNKKQYACPVCEKLFARPKILQIHQRTHTGEKPLKCNHCKKSFYNDACLTKHMKSIRHLKCINNNEGKIIEIEKPYSCSKCDAKFYHHQSLLRHEERTHSACESVKCPYCDYCTKIKTNLKRHLELHVDIKRFVCEICGIAFRAFATLKAHKLFVHSENREFICSVCSKSFKNKSDLQRHNRIHSENRPYKCHCNKNYKRMSHLKRHMISAHQLSLEKNKLPILETTMNLQASLSSEKSVIESSAFGSITDDSSCDDFSLPLSNYEDNKTTSKSKDSKVCIEPLSLPSDVQHDSMQTHLNDKNGKENVVVDKTRNTYNTDISSYDLPSTHDTSFLDSLNLSPKNFNFDLSSNNPSCTDDVKGTSSLQVSNPSGDLSLSSSTDGVSRPQSLPNLNFQSQTSDFDAFTPFSPPSIQVPPFLFTNDILSPSYNDNLNLDQNSPSKQLFNDAACVLSLSPFISDGDFSGENGMQNFTNTVSDIDLWDTTSNNDSKNSVNEFRTNASTNTNLFSNYKFNTNAFNPHNLFTNESLVSPTDAVSFNIEFDALTNIC